MPSVHWVRGGSISDPIMECSGRVNMVAQYPRESGSSAAAIDGTHSHTLLEYCLDHNIYDAHLVVSKVLTDGEGSFTVDADRADRVNRLLKYIGQKVNKENYEVWSEAFTDAGKRWGIPGWGGSVDVTLLPLELGDPLEIVDYKDGGKPVSVKTWQLVTYGTGVINELRERKVRVPNRVRLGICQPKVNTEIQWVGYSLEEFEARSEELAEGMRRSMDPDAPRKAGEHCKYCPGARAGRCPEYNQGAQMAIQEAFAGIPAPTQPGAGGAQLQALPFQLPEINADTPVETLAALIDAKPALNAIIKEAEEEATKRARSGTRIPGQKLARSITQRKFVSDALDNLKKMRVPKEMYLDEKLKSPKGVIESDAFKGLSEPRRKKIEALIVKPEGGIVLVPETDPRQEYLPAQEAFKDVAPPPQEPAAPAAPVAPPTLSFL